MTINTYNSLTPKVIAATDKVRDVKVSPDGARVLYQVQPFYNIDKYTNASLWTAHTDHADSAQQLTGGLFHDHSAVFHPAGDRVVFLSDRHQKGGPLRIYSLALDGGDADVILLAPHARKRGVSSFDISPDGKYVAFTMQDESLNDSLTKGALATEKEPFRLWLYTSSTGAVQRLEIPRNRNVESFSWSPDSTRILYRYKGVDEVRLEHIPIAFGDAQPVLVGSYPRSPASRSVWTSAGDIVDIQSFKPHLASDAKALFTHTTAHEFTDAARLYGVDEDGIRIVDLRVDGMVAVEIACGIDSRIDVASGGKRLFTIFETDANAIWFGAWDARRLADGTFVVAAVLSSGINHQPPNVWAQRVDVDGAVVASLQLSSHLGWLAGTPRFRTEVMKWKSKDGVELDGIIRYLANNQYPTKHLPTVLLLHGGPYRRDIPDFMPYFCNWRELLACEGYLVLSPNYRGSQGRGHGFASAEYSSSGSRLDWADCESMVDEAVKRGLSDPGRLGVGGWSHGGYLAAWGVTQTKNKFRAAAVGAAVSGWVSKSNADGSNCPVSAAKPGNAQQGGDPSLHAANVETAVLIMHGEQDKRIPVSAAVTFMEQIERQAKCPERSRLVIYPREPHGFTERGHAEDVLARVLEHFNTWL